MDQAKTQVWRSVGGCPPGCEDWWQPAGLLLLGGPLADEDELTAGVALLGSDGYVGAFLDAKLEKFQDFLEAVERVAEDAAPHLPRTQSAFLLLRVCGLGRLTHLARLLPPTATAAFTKAADDAVLASFTRLALLDGLTEEAAEQAQLSLGRGGFGLRSLNKTREAAWVGSWLGTLPRVRESCPDGWASKAELTRGNHTWSQESWARALLDATDALEAAGAFLDADGEACPDPPESPWSWEDGFQPLRRRQRELSQKLEDQRLRDLLQTTARTDRARLRSCGGPGAGTWLAAIPADAGLSFSDEEFATACRFRLGQDLSLEGHRCANCYTTGGEQHRVGDRCRGRLDAKGLHAATCLVGGHRTATHNGQRDLWAQHLPSAGFAVQREQHVPGWDRRVRRANGTWFWQRAVLDLRLEAPPDAPVTYLDVKVTHPCSATYVAGAARENGFAAQKAEEAKHTRYPANTPGVSGRLVPLVVETYGRWGKEGLRFLKKATGRTAARTTALAVLGEEGPPAVLGAWLQRQAVALQKSNVAALKAAAGAAAVWAQPDFGHRETVLDVLAEAERLAAAVA